MVPSGATSTTALTRAWATYDEPGKLVGGVKGSSFQVVIASNQAIITGVNGLTGPVGPATTLTIGTVTDIAAGNPPTASLTGPAGAQILNLGLVRGTPGTGAPTSADILAIAEKDRLERSLATAGVPDEPSLILDFVRAVQFASKGAITASILTLVTALGGVSAFSRASTGTYFDSDGLMKTAANNVPRLEYDPVSRLPRGLLMETQARTNLCLRSQEIENASWSKVRTTVTANAASAPDGTTTADKIIEDASASLTHFVLSAGVAITAGATVTGSFFVKAAERTFANVTLLNNVSPFEAIRLPVNLTDGSTGTLIVANGASAGSFRVSAAGNGWWRIEITGIFGTATTINLGVQLAVDATAGGPSYTGNGSSGVFAWGGQVEVGGGASSYIPTAASAVARSADVLTLAAGAWTNAAETTLAVEFSTSLIGPVGSAISLAEIGDGTYDNRIGTYLAINVPSTIVVSGAAVSANLSAGAYAAGSVGRLVLASKLNDFAASFAASAVGTDSSGPIPVTAATALFVGRSSGGGAGYMGHIRRVLVYPQRLSNTKVQALSNQTAWS